MPAQLDQTAILQALSAVQDPDLRRDIVSLGFVIGRRTFKVTRAGIEASGTRA